MSGVEGATDTADGAVRKVFSLRTALQPYSRAIPAFAGGTSLLCIRDRDALGFLAGFRCLSCRQLCELLLPEGALARASREPITRRVLHRLRTRGLVTTSGALPDSPQDAPSLRVHLLTPEGRRAYAFLDARFPLARLRTPSLGSLAHALLLADIAIVFRGAVERAAGPAITWECDWETVSRIGSTLVIPDALLTYELERRRIYAFIEADRATEHSPAFERKIARYLRLYRSDRWRDALPVWPLVLTITTTPRQARRLRRCAAHAVTRAGELHLLSRFRFTSFGELCGPRGPLGQIWQVAGRDGLHPPIDARSDPSRAQGGGEGG